MQHSRAREIAGDTLIWLCGSEDLLPVFLAASGAIAQDLRAALAATEGPDAALSAAALDFVLMQDTTVLDCARALDLPPEELAQAQAVLAGQGQRHWT